MTDTPAADANVSILFLRGSPPYESGDVAGFPQATAQRYVDAGAAAFTGPLTPVTDTPPAEADDEFTAMDRAALIAYGKANLGMTDEPPADTTDDALRVVLRTAAAQPGAKSTKKSK